MNFSKQFFFLIPNRLLYPNHQVLKRTNNEKSKSAMITIPQFLALGFPLVIGFNLIFINFRKANLKSIE